MVDQGKYLLRGGRVLCMTDEAASEARLDILVENGRITKLADGIQDPEAKVIDATDRIVMPGFVDTHRHTWQTPLRTVATDWSLQDYILQMRCIFSAFFSPEDVYLANHIGALESLNAGITTLVDHCHIINSPDHGTEAVRGLQDSGIRAIFCNGFWPNPTSFTPLTAVPGEAWRYEAARAMRRGMLSSDTERVLFGIAPGELEGLPFDFTAREIGLARELGAHRISMHIAMGAYDQGHRYLTRLHREGLLGKDMLFVHGAALTDEELALIRQSGAGISATPETELQMGMGMPVIPRALKAGVATSIGIDIVSNYAAEMFTQMRLALQVMRAQVNETYEKRGKSPRVIRPLAAEVLHMATLGGAQAAGLADRVGTIEVGKQADLILLRTDTIHMAPSTHAVGAVVLNASPGDVDTVMVAGRIVKQNGSLVGVDWPQLRKKLTASAERIFTESSTVAFEPIQKFVDCLFPNNEI